MSGIVMLYITFPDEKEAEKIGRIIIKEKLAACCNIISNNVTSIYYWKGEINSDKETVMIAKTTENKVKKLTDRIKKLHLYDIPCIVTLPINDGNQDFIDWIRKEAGE